MVQCPDRIIASMDTGVDDALALAYLLGSADECELGGVIASYGNVDANTAYANTCAVLDLFGRADIPVLMICLVMICLVMICLGMTCLWMCPMRLFLLAGIWRGMFMLIRRWVLVLV